mmetsp:Transcript_59328/g.140078  ORF Transcript_59328/g.140078 Transcript_59328/m.140078 type:complete len:358 (+) Transcript_59328:176-1249(+)
MELGPISGLLVPNNAPLEATSIRLESVHESLSSPFVKTSVSYGVTLTGSARGLLEATLAAIGPAGTPHSVPVAGETSELLITDVTVQPNKFVIVKGALHGTNVSLKVYLTSYLQLFGLKDTAKATADVHAAALISWIINLLNAQGMSLAASTPSVLAMSAFHVGVSESGYRFDADALEAVLRTVAPTAMISRNPRNNSVVVRHGPASGSQIFHATGTTQLMGVRSEPNEYMTALRLLIAANPHVLIPQDKKRKRRKNMITGTSFGMAEAPAKAMRGLENSSVETPSPIESPPPSTPSTVPTSAELVLEELLSVEDNGLTEELSAVLAEHAVGAEESAMDKLAWLDDEKADLPLFLTE